MSAREIEAYRLRLARRSVASDLTAECIGAVIRFTDMTSGVGHEGRIGTLTGFRIYVGPGLFGPMLQVDVTICDKCVGRSGGNFCEDSEPITLYGATEIHLVRNEDGAELAVSA